MPGPGRTSLARGGAATAYDKTDRKKVVWLYRDDNTPKAQWRVTVGQAPTDPPSGAAGFSPAATSRSSTGTGAWITTSTTAKVSGTSIIYSAISTIVSLSGCSCTRRATVYSTTSTGTSRTT